MKDCHFFAIAVDTALFEDEHLYSCFARYSFDGQIIQLPLFFATCFVSSGKDMAEFLFDKLIEKDVDFSKLVCVSTDGATNMVGQMNGMAVNLKRLIRQHCLKNIIPFFDFHSVWCLAHRANLVTQDFLNMKMVNAVLSFVDWFATKRRLGSYKRFLATHFPNLKTKRVPKPSETRWLFFRDVVQSILTQTTFIEAFLIENDEFKGFWNEMRSDAQKNGLCVQQDFSLNCGLFISTMRFTSFILEFLGRVNTVFQERYATVSQLWDVVEAMKTSIMSWAAMLSLRNVTEFEFMSLEDGQIKQFQHILEELLHSVEMRFPCPTISLDMKVKRLRTGASTSQQEQSTPSPSCSIRIQLEFHEFPDNLINNHLLPRGFPSFLNEEVQTITNDIVNNRERIVEAHKERTRLEALKTGNVGVGKITLCDVFKVLERTKFPLLWKEVIKMKTIMPTTVCCEQGFSVTKRAWHVNMATSTVIANVTNKIRMRTTLMEL